MMQRIQLNSLHMSNLIAPRTVSNITNSSDPKSIHSRVFIGNLNTFTLTKDDVETVFKRYGRIIGISMHKGYAFVQYTNEHEARNSVSGEDQRVYANQQIDVNIAAEPKPNRPSRKRPQGAGAEWDYYYNVPMIPGQCPLPPTVSLKRPRTDLGPGLITPPGLPPTKRRSLVPVGMGAVGLMNCHIGLLGGRTTRARSRPGGSFRTLQIAPMNNEDSDILICGNCKELLPTLKELSEHKQAGCQKLSLCECNSSEAKQSDEPSILLCATCNTEFSSCWELCRHCQSDHGLSIYNDTNGNRTLASTSSDMASQTTSSTIYDDKCSFGDTETMLEHAAERPELYDTEEEVNECVVMGNGQKESTDESVGMKTMTMCSPKELPARSEMTSNGDGVSESPNPQVPTNEVTN